MMSETVSYLGPPLSLPVAFTPFLGRCDEPHTAFPQTAASVAHSREQHDLADRSLPRQDHDQPVDSDSDPAGRWHSLLQRLEKRLVIRLRLLVARSGEGA